MLSQMEAFMTTDHWAFYENILEEKRAQRVGKDLKWATEKEFFNLQNHRGGCLRGLFRCTPNHKGHWPPSATYQIGNRKTHMTGAVDTD